MSLTLFKTKGTTLSKEEMDINFEYLFEQITKKNLPDIKVANIAQRNLLATNGIVLDNQNVLVFDASADPDNVIAPGNVGYYKYNATGGTWTLLTTDVQASFVVNWGDIAGTLADQADLQAALDGILPAVGGNANKLLTVKEDESGVEWRNFGGFKILQVTANQTLPAGKYIVVVDVFGGVTDINLPAPAEGAEYYFVDKNAFFEFLPVTITCTSSPNSFYGGMADNYVLKASGMGSRIVSDGTYWYPANNYTHLQAAIEKQPYALLTDTTVGIQGASTSDPNHAYLFSLQEYSYYNSVKTLVDDTINPTYYSEGIVTVSATNGGFTLTREDNGKVASLLLDILNGHKIRDDIFEKGFENHGDYEANFTARSLITKQYDDSRLTALLDALEAQTVISAGQNTAIKTALGI